MKFTSDIDIDFADRSQILKLIQHVPASIDAKTAHNTGVYVTEIPVDPRTGRASLDYHVAESRGYIKLDFLNVNLYNQISSPKHLDQLLAQEPPWHELYSRPFCEQLIHIGRHYDTLLRMPEPVTDISKLAMFLAVIRPAKRDLIGRPWSEVAGTVWLKSSDGSYGFKQSHGLAYAHLVAVNMVLLDQAK